MKRWKSFWMSLLFCVLLVQPCLADGMEDVVSTLAPNITVTAPSAILVEAQTGQVLFSKEEAQVRAPASVTKIMTMLLTLEAVEKGTITLDEMVTGSQTAKELGGTQINLDIGEQMTVYDLMMAVAVASANDAAMALGEHVAGSESGFITMMNQRAAELGMEHTVFSNPHGLPQEGHETTAEDIAKMTAQLLKTPEATTFIGCETYTVRPDTHPYQMRNTNKLLNTYEGCLGGKTGYTADAGYCMSVAAEREGLTLIAVVMGATTKEGRTEDLKTLLDYGFGHYQSVPVEVQPVQVDPIDVSMGMQAKVEVDLPTMQVNPLIVEKGTQPEITQNVQMKETVPAPISVGDELGSVVVLADGQVIAEFFVTAKQEIQERSTKNVLKELFLEMISS